MGIMLLITPTLNHLCQVDLNAYLYIHHLDSLITLDVSTRRAAGRRHARSRTGTIDLVLDPLRMVALLFICNFLVAHDAGGDTVLRKGVLLDILERSLAGRGVVVPVNEDIAVLSKVAIEILQSAVRSLGIEKVDYGHKGKVEDCPDDVEFPAERLDA